MVWPNRTSALVISLCLLLLYPAVAEAEVPASFITEEVSVGYSADGAVTEPLTRRGYVEVEVPNTQDVLQYLLLDLDVPQMSDTNLQSAVAYKGAAASPTIESRTRLYINTTSSMSNISYEITNPSITPVLYLDLEHSNELGGADISAGGQNAFRFNATLNSTMSLSSVTVYIRFPRNTQGSRDSFSLRDAGASSGSAMEQDGDSDGEFDTIRWTGSVGPGGVEIWFAGDTEPGVTFDESLLSIDLDQGGSAEARHQDNSGTYTDITFSDRFSRGPVREGITLMTMSTWAVRGFITNMAGGLDYVTHGWELYRVGEASPVAYSGSVPDPGPGETVYTDWHDTGTSGSSSDPGYYSVAWDWEVDWGVSVYSSSSTAELEMPTLYEMEVWSSGGLILENNEENNTVISVSDTARHIGHASLGAGSVEIAASLPWLSESGVENDWSPSNVRVYHVNGTDQTDITAQASIYTEAAGSTDGVVFVNISDVSSVLGGPMGQNEDIRLAFDVSGDSHGLNQDYEFCQTSTMVTESGTPASSTSCETITIPGVGGYVPPDEGGGGGGGGSVAPALFADIMRAEGEAFFIADNQVRVRGLYRVYDTGSKGVKDTRLLLYIPEYGRMDSSSLSIRILDSSTGQWTEWIKGTDYNLEDNGMTVFGGGSYREYEIIKASERGTLEESLVLHDRDELEVEYESTVPVGTSFLVTRLNAYNYYEDSYMFEDIYVPVRREGKLQDPYVTEGPWTHDKIYTGRPVKWVKTLEVTNPNNASMEHVRSFDVFDDTMSAYSVTQEGAREELALKESGSTYVDMLFRLGPGQTRSYALEAVTPPILETSRSVEVMESSETEITFEVNITLRNFAGIDYDDVSLLFSTEPDRVVSVREEGKPLNHSTFDPFTTEVYLGDMDSGWERTITVVYSQVPPILMAAMESSSLTCAEKAEMKILLVPAQRESQSYIEFEVVGPEPELRTINAQLIELRELWPWEEVEIPVTVDVSAFPDGRYYVQAVYKKSFGTIMAAQTDFTINCPERMLVTVSWLGFMGVAVAIIAFLLIRAWKRKRSGEFDEIKKRLRELK